MSLRGDFLVIGSGIAGLRAAISLAESGSVVILTKAEPRESNTGYAQGGIAAAVGADDSPELHGRDTIAAGDGLCVPGAVQALVTDGPRYVRELLEWGAAFDRDEHGQPSLAREAAHTVRRVLHAKDATGREIGRVLWQKVARHPRVTVRDDAQALSLRVAGGACTGATFIDRDGVMQQVEAARTLIATGGAGQVFLETTNPAVATGDGIAMAFDAGARVVDLEFVQFHPTVLGVEGGPRFLLSEALRGEGARLINEAGEPFVSRYEPAGDLASRDLVARAMVTEMERTGARVYLSMAHLDPAFLRRRFPTIDEACRRAGFDLTTDRIPVSPAAHYLMGGIETDLHGRTSIEGLFAAGEAACTGVHGANRLASNSLLEGLVFGARAAEAMAGAATAAVLFGALAPCAGARGAGQPGRPSAPAVPAPIEVRRLMWRHVGLVRSRERLEEATATLDGWRGAVADARSVAGAAPELRKVAAMVTVGWLVARAALRREESRGAHFRTDFPRHDEIHWLRHVSDSAGRP